MNGIRSILCLIRLARFFTPGKSNTMPCLNTEGADLLRFFMEEHNLSQSDLAEVGSQGVVSEILSGKRELNVRQIRALSKRFGVSPSVFV